MVESKLSEMNLYQYNSVLNDTEVKIALKKLKEDFVLTPLDKAGNNLSIVCKKFYVETLKGVIENSSYFIQSPESELNLVSHHQKYYETLKLSFDKKSEKLPFLYWISKIHKNPISFRFITCGTLSSSSFLSENVGYALKMLLKFTSNSSKYNCKFKCYNTYYIIDDHKDILKFMETSNRNRKYGGSKNIRTYDFSNLYTSIPHNKLKTNIRKFILEAFGMKNKMFINVTKEHAYFSNKRSNSSTVTFTNLELIEAVEYIINNSFIKFNGKIYKQVVGIPMGTSCAPYLANLFLYMYEKAFIEKLITNNKIKEAGLLKNIFRYQDDLVVFNDKGYFDTVLNEIYPSELTLKNTNTSTRKSNYLDLTISIVNGKFRYQLFDKRGEFPFKVINYPFISGNIPRIPSYGVYISHLNRFCYIFSESNNLVNTLKELNKKLIDQGYLRTTLERKFKVFTNRYLHLWCKFGVDMTSHDFINDIF